MIAEPASTVAGDEEKAPTDSDVAMGEATTEESPKVEESADDQTQTEDVAKSPSPPKSPLVGNASREEALLPPPPEEVGNISSPKADDGQDRSSEGDDKSRDGPNSESAFAPERPPLHAHDSVMTEDTIKPEDSASVKFPLTESGAPSEAGTGSVDDTRESAVAPAEPIMEEPKEPSPAQQISPVLEDKEDSAAPLGAVEETADLGELKGVTPKEETLNADSAPAEVQEQQVSPPAPEPQPILEPKEPTPPAPVSSISPDEPVSAPEQSEVQPHQEEPVQEADVPMEETKSEPAVEGLEQPKDEPAAEQAPESAIESATNDEPGPTFAEPAEAPLAETEVKKEDTPANA
jgi:hypothetical protein